MGAMTSSMILNSNAVHWKLQFQSETLKNKESKMAWEFQISWGETSLLRPFRKCLRYLRGTHWSLVFHANCFSILGWNEKGKCSL